MIQEAETVLDLQDCIKNRRPCVFRKLLPEFHDLPKIANLKQLRRYAGSTTVSVEPISEKGTFGTSATKHELSFEQFLDKLEASEKLYLTTQYTETQGTDVPLEEPLRTLKEHCDFPSLPECIGKLVTAKINLWLGATNDGTSSGLHHDFHDNVYILLSGSKTFRLLKPTWTICDKLKLHGRPHQIYENGLITYNGRLCADGLLEVTKAQLRADMCERRLQDAEALGEGVESAEAAYEFALEALLEAKLGDDEASEDGTFEDATSEEGNSQVDVESLTAVQDHAGQDEGLRILSSSIVSNDVEPPSFSRLTSDEVSQLLKDETAGCREISLEAGQMLYLPASYFHEVISKSGTDEFHMAVNYWFYPPDNGQGGYTDAELFTELANTLRCSKSPDDHEPVRKRAKISGKPD